MYLCMYIYSYIIYMCMIYDMSYIYFYMCGKQPGHPAH